MKTLLISAVLGLIIIAACGGSALHTIRGEFTLTDDSLRYVTATRVCIGGGGYDDLQAGAQVRVKDASGTVIGTGSLKGGSSIGGRKCVFLFEVENLPQSDFYSIEVTHRGGISYSYEELEARDWKVSLTIGN
jgi:serine/threonine-protein kinase